MEMSHTQNRRHRLRVLQWTRGQSYAGMVHVRNVTVKRADFPFFKCFFFFKKCDVELGSKYNI